MQSHFHRPDIFQPIRPPGDRTGLPRRQLVQYHNNPIRITVAESMAIWLDDKQSHPDIVLSIGTGYYTPKSVANNTAES